MADKLRKTILVLATIAVVYSAPGRAEPPKVSLADYAFDFATYGYEITVSGTTRNLTDKLTADDYIRIRDEGYTIKTLIDRMGRKDRQQFIRFFNEHCITGFTGKGCAITATGDVELDDDMRMIFRISSSTIAKGGAEWTNSP